MPLQEQKIDYNSITTFSLRSEEVQEIISKPPSWIIRWGITVFFFVLMIIVFASYLIQYPDIIKAPFKLVSQNTPKSVLAHTDGKLVKLLVAESQVVKKGEALGFIESTASHDEVIKLSSQLDDISTLLSSKHFENIALKHIESFNRLGEIQTAYQTFNQAYTQFISFQSKGFYPAKKKILQKELSDLQVFSHTLEEQKKLYEKDEQLAHADFEAQTKLHEQKVIAPLEYKKEESKLIGKQMPIKQMEASIFNNLSAQSSKQKELLEIDKTIIEHESVFLQALNTMKSNIESWKQKFMLTAPNNGKVYFSSFLQENQSLTVNQEIFFIGTSNVTEFGEVKIPQNNFGKIKKGQKVIIKFNSYPFNEFGAVIGKIDFISEIPSKDSTFLAKVILPDGLITTYKKQLIFKPGMNAVAEIVTEDTRLIEKIFYSFRKALKS